MKLNFFVPPLLALVLAGGWLGSRRHVLSKVEQENSVIRAKLNTYQASVTDDSANTGAAAPLDWKKLSLQAMKLNRTGFGGAALKKRFEAMSKEELVSSLEEISKLESGPRSVLREMLTTALLKKDPAFALDLLVGTIEEDLVYVVANGIKDWALAAPQAAATWFDRELEKGTFSSKRIDGLNALRHRMEPALISSMISSAPEEAARRLTAMTGKDRQKMLHEYAEAALPDDKQAAFVTMMRKLLPAENAAQLIDTQCNMLVFEGGYPAASRFFNLIGATPEERDACIDNSAAQGLAYRARTEKITLREVEELRTWVRSEVPAATDRSTGTALARIGSNDYTAAAALAAAYHESTGNDVVLSTFLEGWESRQHAPEARILAGKLRDAEKREYLLRKFGN